MQVFLVMTNKLTYSLVGEQVRGTLLVQDSESLAKDEVQKVLQMTEEKRRAWEKAWDDQRKRLEQNFQVCQFRFDLKQVCIGPMSQSVNLTIELSVS